MTRPGRPQGGPRRLALPIFAALALVLGLSLRAFLTSPLRREGMRIEGEIALDFAAAEDDEDELDSSEEEGLDLAWRGVGLACGADGAPVARPCVDLEVVAAHTQLRAPLRRGKSKVPLGELCRTMPLSSCVRMCLSASSAST